MKIPLSTYRIQFNPAFKFKEAKNIIPYLKKLGISSVYASPIQQSKAESQHGYDMTDYTRIDSQLGGENNFQKLIKQIQNIQMGWIQDIVPNHMAYHPANPFIYDILKKGNQSAYSKYFDIDWQQKDTELHGKLLFPFLEKPLDDCLRENLFQLSYKSGKFFLKYHDFNLPLKQDSLREVLPFYTDLIPPDKQNSLPATDSTKISWLLDMVNKNNSPSNHLFWQRLLMEQHYLPGYWKDSRARINYRRFFSINELICLKTETKNVFDSVHQFIFKEVQQENITGLRIDHLDGLFNPKQYLERLHKGVPGTYTIVEKILQPAEMLPLNFSAEGTTGYDFLYYVNNLFCQKKNKTKFFNIYHSFTGQQADISQLLLKKKKLILKQQMYGDLNNLTNLFYEYYQQNQKNIFPLISKKNLLKALQEILISFPSYRTYISQSTVSKKETNIILQIINQAKTVNPELKNEFQLIAVLMTSLLNKTLNKAERKKILPLIMRLQQLTGPLMAKGMEDTLLYCYHPLLSLNEVGGEPENFGITKNNFYSFIKKRRRRWPYSMNASTTHDTKRGEDVRSRINVLSEMPVYWQKKLTYWHQLNSNKKTEHESLLFPDNNMEYFFYQTLIGTLPFSGLKGINENYIERIQKYLLKAAREAKVFTSWLNPFQPYETILNSFTKEVLEKNNNFFLSDLCDFQKHISHYGLLNSLSQTVLKLTCPGVPDFYQGAELWDFRLVDPDNRQAVNYNYRIKLLQEIITTMQNNEDYSNMLKDFLNNPEDGKIKLFLIYQLLKLRNREQELFLQGSFSPLPVYGKYKNNVISYLRVYNNKIFISVVPRFCTKLVEINQFPLGTEIWENTFIKLPKNIGHSGCDLINEQPVRLIELTPVGNILKYFPTAVILTNKEN